MERARIGGGEREAADARAPGLDLWVLAAWWLLVVVVGFARTDYTGDGLRHLDPIVAGAGLRLGEPRWLLFPGFLYAVLRPFVVTGLAPNVESLAHVMMGATVLAAGAYMLALRSCLVAARVDAPHRAAALALAGASAGLLLASTDLMEPIFGATLVVCGLAWASRRVAAPGATAADRRRALLVAVALIALAALMYQGLVLGIGLVPLVIPHETLRERRAQLLSLLILAFVPVVMVGALMLAGNNLPHALARALQGEENHFYSSFMKKTGVMARVVPLIAGPPQGLVTMGDFHGFNGLLAGLRGAGRRDALETLGVFGFAGCVVLAGLVGAARRRDLTVLVAFAVLMLLPVVRCQQYGYLKYYILMAVVVAFAAARARPSVVALAAVGLLFFNVGPTLRGLPASRRFAAERTAVYTQAGPNACWLTTGWLPAFSFRWPGRVCAVLGSLASGHGETDAEVMSTGHAAMTGCLDACFCQSSGVYTDDMLEAQRSLVLASAQQFRYTVVDLGALMLPDGGGEPVSATSAVMPVYRYPAADQRRLCARLTAPRAPRP